MLDRTSATLLNIFLKALAPSFSSPEIFYRKNGHKTARWLKDANIFEVTILPSGFMEFFISGAGADTPLGAQFFDGVTPPTPVVNQIAVTMGI